MNDKTIKEILEKSVMNLFSEQPNIYNFSSETNQTEWNLAHHLANQIHSLFPYFDCDLDVTKPNLDNKRPDIILHKRGIVSENNFLVIELKRDGSMRETNDDIEKIKMYWFVDPLAYQFGAVVNLKNNKSADIQVIKNSGII